MILEHAGGEASEVVIAGAVPDTSRSYTLDTDRVQSLVGMSIPAETQKQTLNSANFKSWLIICFNRMLLSLGGQICATLQRFQWSISKLLSSFQTGIFEKR
jgi:hypothetical protein